MKKYALYTALLLSGIAVNRASATSKDVKPLTIIVTDTLKKGKNYILFSKTENIRAVRLNKSKKSKEEVIKIHFGYPTPVPVTKTASSLTIDNVKIYKPEDGQALVFDKILILKGGYGTIQTTAETYIRNLFTLGSVTFPIRLQLTFGKELVDFELTEPGEWDLEIELKDK